jgi:cathepsin A (carboxypeptidase C)
LYASIEYTHLTPFILSPHPPPGHGAFNAASDEPWSVTSQEAGLIRSAKNFTFLQVYDAGHMVPHDKPEAAQTLLDSFINNAF